jgi:hypothetical protein
MPVLGAEEAEGRDAMVFQLYLAGMPYRQIAARPEIKLSVRGVQLAVDRARARRDQQRDNIGDVTSLLIERYEQLFQIAYRREANGELRPNDQCRKLLVELGRLHGLEGVRSLAPPPGEDDGYDDDGLSPAPPFDPDDELARYRLP